MLTLSLHTCIKFIKFTLDDLSDNIRPNAEASGTVRNERKKLLAWQGDEAF